MMKRNDQISSLACLLLAVYICLQSLAYSIGSWRYPGPGFFPLGMGIFLGLLSITVYSRVRSSKPQEKEEPWYPRERRKALILVLIALFGYAIFLEILGFLISTFLLLFFLFIVVEPQRWIVAAGGSLLASFSSYALFELCLKIRLPKGLWGF
jgi:putative tricarboxylic transport membrane protein